MACSSQYLFTIVAGAMLCFFEARGARAGGAWGQSGLMSSSLSESDIGRSGGGLSSSEASWPLGVRSWQSEGGALAGGMRGGSGSMSFERFSKVSKLVSKVETV